MHLLGWSKAVEFAEKTRAIPSGPLSEVGNEGLDQIPAGLAEFLSAAEISGIKFDQGGIELMLADQKTKSVTKSWLAIAGAVPIGMAGSDSLPTCGFGSRGKIPELFDRTESNAISLAQGPVNGASFGYAHLGAMHQWGDIRRVCVPPADEAMVPKCLINSCFEDPTVGSCVG